MGQTHDINIDPIEQELELDDRDGKLIMRFVMKALKEKEDGETHP